MYFFFRQGRSQHPRLEHHVAALPFLDQRPTCANAVAPLTWKAKWRIYRVETDNHIAMLPSLV